MSVAALRLLVCGDRHWQNRKVMERELTGVVARHGPIEALIEGEAEGADKLARDIATAHGWPVVPFPALWKVYGKAAGPIRNTQMLREGRPNLVVAFHHNILKSVGTLDMITQAQAADVRGWVVTGTGLRLDPWPRNGSLFG